MEFGDVRTLLVSPHQDDIALSLGGTLLLGEFERPILILNIFTLTNYAPFLNEAHTVANVSRVRAREDEAFAKELGLVHLDLGFKDALVRWNFHRDTFPLLHTSSLTRGFPPPRRRIATRSSRYLRRIPINSKAALLQNVARFDKTYAKVKSEISRVASLCPKAAIVSPLSLGSHPDHVIVACACRDMNPRATGMIFYEDLPYAWGYKAREIPRHVNQFDRQLAPRLVDIGSVFVTKIANLGLYSSQLATAETEAVIKHSRRLDGTGVFERLWFSRSS